MNCMRNESPTLLGSLHGPDSVGGSLFRLCKTMRAPRLDYGRLVSTSCFCGGLNFSYLPDYPTISLDKCEVISEAAFQQYADTIVACRICGCDQSHIFSDSPMSQMHKLRQNEDFSYNWRLDFGYFTTEVFEKDFFSLTTKRNRLLIYQLERLINLV